VGEPYLLLAPVLAVAIVMLLGFIGCSADEDPGNAYVWHIFRYDPNLLVNNVKVMIRRVDFIIRFGDSDQDYTQTLVAGAAAALDTSFAGLPESFFFDEADPLIGSYTFVFLGVPRNVSRWRVRCNAYRSASDTVATYPAAAGSEIERTLPLEGGQLFFRFTLQRDPNGSWVVVPDGP
jgi:hypothetical protein